MVGQPRKEKRKGGRKSSAGTSSYSLLSKDGQKLYMKITKRRSRGAAEISPPASSSSPLVAVANGRPGRPSLDPKNSYEKPNLNGLEKGGVKCGHLVSKWIGYPIPYIN